MERNRDAAHSHFMRAGKPEAYRQKQGRQLFRKIRNIASHLTQITS